MRMRIGRQQKSMRGRILLSNRLGGYAQMMIDHVALLRELLAQYGDKQEVLAKELGVSQPTVSRWLKGIGEIKAKHLDRIAQLATLKELVNHDPFADDAKRPITFPNAIPEIELTGGLGGGGLATVENTSKGGITFAKEVIRDHWRLPDWILARMNVKPKNLAAFPVQGDSMEPTLEDGDVVFIDTAHRIPSPDGIYALADEFGNVVVKRLEVTSRPGDEIVNVSIISDNPRHRARDLTLPEIYIVGRYVGRFSA